MELTMVYVLLGGYAFEGYYVLGAYSNLAAAQKAGEMCLIDDPFDTYVIQTVGIDADPMNTDKPHLIPLKGTTINDKF
jgi:hypothetical protein